MFSYLERTQRACDNNPMKIIVGTKNEKKVSIVQSVFESITKNSEIEIIKHDAPSGVPEAPHDKETYTGAMNRAKACTLVGDADYYIGIESGLVNRYGEYFEEAWAVIIPNNSKPLIGYSSGLMLPAVVVERMKNGEMHNEIMADYDKLFNLPDDNRDTWSRYTGGTISREISLAEAVRNALIQTSESDRNLYKF